MFNKTMVRSFLAMGMAATLLARGGEGRSHLHLRPDLPIRQ